MGETELRYTADAQMGGKHAQIGSRPIGGAARKLADKFLALSSKPLLRAARRQPKMMPAMSKPPDRSKPDDEETRRPGLSWPLWVIGLIATIAAILAVFGR